LCHLCECFQLKDEFEADFLCVEAEFVGD